jgi:hypothetical protein
MPALHRRERTRFRLRHGSKVQKRTFSKRTACTVRYAQPKGEDKLFAVRRLYLLFLLGVEVR